MADNVISMDAARRMKQERFQAEAAFEARYLASNAKIYEFFGCKDEDFKRFKREGWPDYKEREKPDYKVDEAGTPTLYECVGSGGSVVKIRYTKPMSMAHWCATLDADGYYAIYDEKADAGYLVHWLTMDKLLNHPRVTIQQYDNKLWIIPMDLIVEACKSLKDAA